MAKIVKAEKEVKKPVAKKVEKPQGAKAEVKKPAAKKPEAKVAEKKTVAVTTVEQTKAKKVATKIKKEDELGRRLARAKSSLMAGVAAAMKIADEVKAEPVSQMSPGSYMTRPVTTTKPVKSNGAVSFDSINKSDSQPTLAPRPATTPSKNKVSFDSLLQSTTSQESGNDLDILKFVKK